MLFPLEAIPLWMDGPTRPPACPIRRDTWGIWPPSAPEDSDRDTPPSSPAALRPPTQKSLDRVSPVATPVSSLVGTGGHRLPPTRNTLGTAKDRPMMNYDNFGVNVVTRSKTRSRSSLDQPAGNRPYDTTMADISVVKKTLSSC